MSEENYRVIELLKQALADQKRGVLLEELRVREEKWRARQPLKTDDARVGKTQEKELLGRLHARVEAKVKADAKVKSEAEVKAKTAALIAKQAPGVIEKLKALLKEREQKFQPSLPEPQPSLPEAPTLSTIQALFKAKGATDIERKVDSFFIEEYLSVRDLGKDLLMGPLIDPSLPLRKVFSEEVFICEQKTWKTSPNSQNKGNNLVAYYSVQAQAWMERHKQLASNDHNLFSSLKLNKASAAIAYYKALATMYRPNIKEEDMLTAWHSAAAAFYSASSSEYASQSLHYMGVHKHAVRYQELVTLEKFCVLLAKKHQDVAKGKSPFSIHLDVPLQKLDASIVNRSDIFDAGERDTEIFHLKHLRDTQKMQQAVVNDSVFDQKPLKPLTIRARIQARMGALVEALKSRVGFESVAPIGTIDTVAPQPNTTYEKVVSTVLGGRLENAANWYQQPPAHAIAFTATPVNGFAANNRLGPVVSQRTLDQPAQPPAPKPPAATEEASSPPSSRRPVAPPLSYVKREPQAVTMVARFVTGMHMLLARRNRSASAQSKPGGPYIPLKSKGNGNTATPQNGTLPTNGHAPVTVPTNGHGHAGVNGTPGTSRTPTLVLDFKPLTEAPPAARVTLSYPLPAAHVSDQPTLSS